MSTQDTIQAIQDRALDRFDSMQECCKVAGMSPAYWSMIRTGKRELTDHVLSCLAEVLEVEFIKTINGKLTIQMIPLEVDWDDQVACTGIPIKRHNYAGLFEEFTENNPELDPSTRGIGYLEYPQEWIDTVNERSDNKRKFKTDLELVRHAFYQWLSESIDQDIAVLKSTHFPVSGLNMDLTGKYCKSAVPF